MSSSHPDIYVSVPATLMLAGEHAVLHGHAAIVCAVNQRLKVNLQARTDQLFTIDSTIGHYTGHINDLTISEPFKFVTAVIRSYAPYLTTGFNLIINSEFSHQVGLGSSAAVTVATVAALAKWLQQPVSAEHIYRQAYQIILQIQNIGSGADVAASVFGGVGYYSNRIFNYKKISSTLPLATVYSGSKEPTVNVIAKVQALVAKQPEHYQELFSQIADCTQALSVAIEQADWFQVGALFNQHYALQTALGVSNATLEKLIQELRSQPEIQGAKISGSGLGDCIIGIGKLAADTFPQNTEQQLQGIRQLDLEISPEGMRYE